MVAICRLCASLKKSETMTFIRADNHDFCDKLLKCCQLSIDLNNVLPRGVCPECVRNLNASFEFYERVHESQQSLEKLLNVQPKSSKVTETICSVEEEKQAEEQKSLALFTAANLAVDVVKPQSSEEEETATTTTNLDPLTTLEEESNDIDDDAVNQEDPDQEIIKEEKETFTKNDTQTSNEAHIVSEEEVSTDSKTRELIISNDNDFDALTSIEYVDEEVDEDFDFENEQYEVIEVVRGVREEQADSDRDVDLPMRSSPDVVSQDLNYNEEQDASAMDIVLPASNSTNKTSTWFDYPWKCVTCSSIFPTAQELVNHNEEVEQLDTVWFCADCLKVFWRYYGLINHIRLRHRQHLALLCDICNTSVESFKELNVHRQSKHDSEIFKMLICETCGKGFSTMNSLQIHSKCHLPDDLRLRFSCNMCDKKFRSPSNLKFHKKMHAGVKDFVCDQCGKKFIQKANLEEHLVTHLDFHPYECDLCNKLFKTSDRLTKHKKRHTDDKPFSCTWDGCDRTFRTKDAMLTHLRIHTGEMPFQCEYCAKPFRFRSTLMTHHNVHTGVRPFSCVDCDHHFTNWPNYNKHMKRRHGIDVSSKNPRGKKPTTPSTKVPEKKSFEIYEVTEVDIQKADVEVEEDDNYEEEEELKESEQEDFND